MSGVLYTNGPVKVNWNGVQMPVENSTYAYTGGELIQTAPGAMGILKLDTGSVVFICPDSSIRVSRDAAGETRVDVVQGGGRFMFTENDRFRVQVNNTTLSAAPDAGNAPAKHAYTGESVASRDGGCVLCTLSKNLNVSVNEPGARRSVMAAGGDIVTVKGAGSSGGDMIFTVKLPGNLLAGMRSAMVANGVQGLGYLCKCRELRDYAERAGVMTAGLADGGTGPVTDGNPDAPQLPTAQPAVAPPPVPDVTVADSGEPNPFVPGLLPAAGESQPQGGSDVVVPPPLVPGSGPGGGSTVSSS